MDNILYLECASGISGDMTVAALLDLGADERALRKAMQSLPVDGFQIRVSRVKKNGLDACDFDVLLDAPYENHDHDMEYLHGANHGHSHELEGEYSHGSVIAHGEGHGHSHGPEGGYSHGSAMAHGEGHGHSHGPEGGYSHGSAMAHGEGHGHSHGPEGEYSHGPAMAHGEGHSHSHGPESDHSHGPAMAHGEGHGHSHGSERDHSHGPHVHRGLAEILEIIRQADMTRRAKDLAERIFHILAQAEAKAHGVAPEQVHFHEVGAVDSIVDVVAAAVCLDSLDVAETVIPRLCEGTGTVRCQHGVLPIPVPAVLNIVQEHGLPLQITQVEGELVTPTGAAIAAAIRTSGKLPSGFRVKKTGLGAGKRDYACAGILRAMLLEPEKEAAPEADAVCKLEANIDDCTGERLGYAMERLFEAGARDVHYTPVFMKKNRPAYQLNVICDRAAAPRMEQIIFQETTTIGIRRMQVERSVLQRKVREVDTPLGKVLVKICGDGPNPWIYPEYESVARLAREHGLPYEQVNRLAIQEAQREKEHDSDKGN